MDKFSSIGAELRLFRHTKKMTQASMAAKLGIHAQYVSNFERGKCLPPINAMKKIYCIMNTRQKLAFVKCVSEDLTKNYMKKLN